MRQRGFAAVAIALAVVAACNPQPPTRSASGPTTVIELLGGPKSATDYSREITAREVTLATGRVRSWALGRDNGAYRIVVAPNPSQPPAAYLLGQYGVPDLGIYTFPGTGPQQMSRALQKNGPLGQIPYGLSPELALAPNQTVYGNDYHSVVQLSPTGTVVDRWPIPLPIPGTYRGPSTRGQPDGHSLSRMTVALDSAGEPFVWTTNGLNGVLVDLKGGRRTDFPGLGITWGFDIRADGKAFLQEWSYVPRSTTDASPCMSIASNYCDFTMLQSVIELDTRTMHLTARYPVPIKGGELLIGTQTVEVIERAQDYSTLLTLDEQLGTFIEHRVPVGGNFFATADLAGDVYLFKYLNLQEMPRDASSSRNPPAKPPIQDRLAIYNPATGKTSDATAPLLPPPDEEVLAILFRS